MTTLILAAVFGLCLGENHTAESTRRAVGAVYVRWGRTTCPDKATELVYEGIAGGSHYQSTGGGSEYLCLPKSPKWGRYSSGRDTYRGLMFGAEYELRPSNLPFTFSQALYDHDVPCAVCRRVAHSTALMIPAQTDCYEGWQKAYQGYLMSGYWNHGGRSSWACMDEQLELAHNGHTNHNGALFYPVEARCGSLPCPPYVEGRELTCVVCTK